MTDEAGTPDPEQLAQKLQAARTRRRALADCRSDVASALALVAASGASYIRAVRIAGVTVVRP